MFGRKIEKDPQKALDNANKTLNNPLLKGVTKAFLGNDFVEQTDNALAQAQVGINMQKQYQAQSGLDATAEVMSIEDTGKMVNMNPVVRLKLKAQPMMGMPPFEIDGETIVSKISIPRVGDTIKIKYNPVDPTQFTVAQ
jgi:hypothetical protein